MERLEYRLPLPPQSVMLSDDVQQFNSLCSSGNGLIRPDMKDVDCGEDGCLTVGLENKDCLPIHIPVNDTDFAGKKPCLMFVRSMEAPNADCLPGIINLIYIMCI